VPRHPLVCDPFGVKKFAVNDLAARVRAKNMRKHLGEGLKAITEIKIILLVRLEMKLRCYTLVRDTRYNVYLYICMLDATACAKNNSPISVLRVSRSSEVRATAFFADKVDKSYFGDSIRAGADEFSEGRKPPSFLKDRVSRSDISHSFTAPHSGTEFVYSFLLSLPRSFILVCFRSKTRQLNSDEFPKSLI